MNGLSSTFLNSISKASKNVIFWSRVAMVVGVAMLLPAAYGADVDRHFIAEEPLSPPEWYGQMIRETDARSAEQELAGFHVPTGFHVSLVASETTIAKPLNLAFDDQGRLWISQTVTYPVPAASGEAGSDSIIVLEDADGNGSYEKSKTFAEGLNIPIGLLPYQDGVLCFSIPNIWFLRDTDGDGVCDKREVVLGPFDTTRDTHGMINSLRWGPQGWVYACHGYNNQSKVRGSDGNVVEMTSGNVFRFRPDGSRIELYSHGQVNPFGMAYDRWGNLYSADCHSTPLTQLIRGGWYPSFSLPHDGLGFVPTMMRHLHGSTAICGLACANDGHYPADFADNLLSGNVMTSRINRNRLEYTGATARASEQPDFLTSDDPWFRPVDLRFGPDGCLYVADFYNKIIGHYEVAFDHPGRDRHRGRIWKIRYEGASPTTTEEPDSPAPVQPLVRACHSYRLQQLEHWSSRLPEFSFSEAIEAINAIAHLSSQERAQVMEPESLAQMKSWADRLNLTETGAAMAMKSAMELLAIEGGAEDVLWVAHSRPFALSTDDVVLKQATRIAIQGLLRKLSSSPDELQTVVNRLVSISIEHTVELVPILLSLREPIATNAVLRFAEQIVDDRTIADRQVLVRDTLDRLSQVLEAEYVDRYLAVLRKEFSDPIEFADRLLQLAQQQQRTRGKLVESLRNSGNQVLTRLSHELLADLHSGPDRLITWSPDSSRSSKALLTWPVGQLPLPMDDRQNPNASIASFDSLALGEDHYGTWTTSRFPKPDALSFWICGHNGNPESPDLQKNYVRLFAVGPDGSELAEIRRAYPPRNAIGQFIQWDLSEVKYPEVRIQIVDGDNGDFFAWIAVGGFSIEGLNANKLRRDYERVIAYLDCFHWPTSASCEMDLEQIRSSDSLDWFARFSVNQFRFDTQQFAITELLSLAARQSWDDLIEEFNRSAADPWEWEQVSPSSFNQLAVAIGKRCSATQQELLCVRLASNTNGWHLLESLVANGTIASEALRAIPAAWWENLPPDSLPALIPLRPTGKGDRGRQDLLNQRVAKIQSASVNHLRGRTVFVERCSACHRIGEIGKVVGPQLDGVGNRGLERLAEDILWPSRNVDEAFRLSTLLTTDGNVVSGLITQRTDDSVTITNQQGEQTRVLLEEVEKIQESRISLMPDNLHELINDDDIASLIGFLKETYSKK